MNSVGLLEITLGQIARMTLKNFLKSGISQRIRRFKKMKKTQVSISEYWDFFWEQFDMEEANSGGYAEYDNVWKRTKEYVNNQIEIKK